MNDLYQRYQQPTKQVSQNDLVSMYNQIKSSKNPQQLFMNMLSNNPPLKAAYNAVLQSGLTPQQYFLRFAMQQKANPEDVLNLFRNN